MKKKIRFIVLMLCLLVVLAACGEDSSTTDAGNNTGTESVNPESTDKAETSTDAPAVPDASEETKEPTVVEPENTDEVPVVTETPEPTDAPVPTEAVTEEVSDFATVLQAIHSLDTYEEREAYIAGLDTAKYKVETTENADLVMLPNGKKVDQIWTYDMELADYVVSDMPDSRIVYPTLRFSVLETCISAFEEMRQATGDVFLVVITDLATGETDPWGVKIPYTELIEVEEETDWGSEIYYEEDPDAPVMYAYKTVEELVAAKNDLDIYDSARHAMKIMFVEPIYPEEKYDDNWEPTGEYVYYEYEERITYVNEDQLEKKEWSDGYYYYVPDYGYCTVQQDEEGNYYYTEAIEHEIPVTEKGYSVAYDENWGNYLIDSAGNVVFTTEMREDMTSDPCIYTWDTLKYYNDLYDPRFEKDFIGILQYSSEYEIAYMQPEDYPYLSADAFNRLMQRYMEKYDIVIDEEELRIRENMPENWSWFYEDYCNKEGIVSMAQYNEDDEAVKYYLAIDRPDNWFFRNLGSYCCLAVRDDDVYAYDPAHEVEYTFSYKYVGANIAESKENIGTYFKSVAWEASEDDVVSTTIDGKQVFYLEEAGYYDDQRNIYILQDVGLSRFLAVDITTYDMDADTEEFIKQFLLDESCIREK